MISSGANLVGDPETGPSTPRGTFAIQRAAVVAPLEGKEVQDAHEVLDVPWVLRIADGVELFGAYFADRSGEARFHHDIGLSPIDARRVFAWAVGEAPLGWNAWEIPEAERVAVVVRP